ncbi:MAG: hypothetical protein IKR67_08990 [Lachnospiraceae bacterium]|nr:hypothetical protein [Lachnospiraceae bacterium]
MDKIQMQVPIVEMQGDEMTRIIWNMVKDELVEPFIDLKSVCFDLGQENMRTAGESVLNDAAEAVKRYGVGVKCATVNASRIRTSLASGLDAAGYFKTPVAAKGIRACITGWKEPVTLARECQADRIREYAISCLEYALFEKKDLWAGFREPAYKDAFDEAYDSEFKESFNEAGVTYSFMPPAEGSARALKTEGGFIWAMKNADADIASGFISGAFSMPAMMVGCLASASEKYIFEAAHSTGQRLYSAHMNGEETSANSVATILSWTKALRMRGIMDRNDWLFRWAVRMEDAVHRCIEAGFITRDMAPYSLAENPRILNTFEFIRKVRSFYEGEPVAEKPAEPVQRQTAAPAPKPATAAPKTDDPSVEELYEAFFDARSYKRKREILRQFGGKLTDKMITDFAVSLDVVVEDGSWDARYMSLMNCLNQMCRFETDGLR